MMQDLLEKRNSQLSSVTMPLPGASPYDNERPLNIPGRYDGGTLFEVVVSLFPHIQPSQWQAWFDAGHIRKKGVPVQSNRTVRGGESFIHVFPKTVEPDVNVDVRWIWEDDSVVGLFKPAPLPVHPCGRFNRNTLMHFINQVMGEGVLKLVHRLDANTSGLMLFAKSAEASDSLRHQFESGGVEKRYIARVIGQPLQDRFVCDAPIGRSRVLAGGREIEELGLTAITEFQVIARMRDGTSMVEAVPKTGRTNQIRIHLWEMGYPIVGDPAYLPDKQRVNRQTLNLSDDPMCLHAESLRFIHPRDKKPIQLKVGLPRWASF
ncbi:MAG: RluA family pseudouridine synthase [Planctomycetota bacterium]|nr:RluA family pseudouridine synthase [Planctomycetota bacterium]